MKSQRNRIGVAATVVVGVSAALSTAWACTVYSVALGIDQAVVTQGAAVRVQGEGLAGASNGPVEIRWGGSSGRVLATVAVTADGTFAADVTVPEVAPGIYHLSALADGAGLGRAAVEVLTDGPASPSVEPATVDLWSPAAASPQAPAAGPDAFVLAGGALLATGLLAMGAGFTVATVRRRRVLARS